MGRYFFLKSSCSIPVVMCSYRQRRNHNAENPVHRRTGRRHFRGHRSRIRPCCSHLVSGNASVITAAATGVAAVCEDVRHGRGDKAAVAFVLAAVNLAETGYAGPLLVVKGAAASISLREEGGSTDKGGPTERRATCIQPGGSGKERRESVGVEGRRGGGTN